jgi:nucleoside-diphosphate-sugar epimerase
MRVFLAGAAGALGRRLVPMLLDRGHEVTGLVRSERSAAAVRRTGADCVAADALDPEAVRRAVVGVRPEVIVHELTTLSGLDFRHFERSFELTNRFRTEGADHLLDAARRARARRFVAWSYAGWPFAQEGGPVKAEDDALDPDPPKAQRATVDAQRYLERTVTGASGIEGLVLRYGAFYGPGTGIAIDGDQVEAVRNGKFPIVGAGTGVWSFVHIDDAASATAIAVERGASGIYHVVDDDPAPVSEWLPVLADAVGAKPPRHVPAWMARLLIGEHGVAMMTASRGASNAKAKRELGWTPAYPSWREGFRTGLAESPGAAGAAGSG